MPRRNKLSAFVLAGALTLSGVGVLQAHAENCEQRIHKAEHNLNEAMRKHGEHSHQAEQKRRDLEQARQRCGNEHHDDHR